MASVTVTRPDIFPEGTTVDAYLATGRKETPASGAPTGSSAGTGVVTSGVLTIAGLAADQQYILYASSPDRYLRAGAYAPRAVAGAALRGETVPGPYPAVWTNTTRTATANRAHIMRWVPVGSWDITLAAFQVTVAASLDDACSVAIYDAGLNRLATSGAVTGKLNSTGIKTVPLVYSVTAGVVYYVVFTFGAIGGTGATVVARATQDVATSTLFGTTKPTGLLAYADTAHPAPATITGEAYGSAIGTAVLIALREI